MLDQKLNVINNKAFIFIIPYSMLSGPQNDQHFLKFVRGLLDHGDFLFSNILQIFLPKE